MTKIAKKLPIRRIGLGRPGFELMQIPVAEFIGAPEARGRFRWKIWLDYNVKMNAGTYIELSKDGKAYRVTVEPTGEIRDYVEL